MKCTEFTQSFDDYLDDTLDTGCRAIMQNHHDQCPACQASIQQARQLQMTLRALPVPSPGPNFFDHAIQVAEAKHRRRSLLRYSGFGSAIAAGLMMFALNLPLLQTNALPLSATDQAPAITISLYQTQDVRLVFHAEHALKNARFTLQLPPQVELRGFPNQRLISWTGSLQQGENLLALPVTARLAGRGQLTAQLEHQGKTQKFSVELITKELQQSLFQGLSIV